MSEQIKEQLSAWIDDELPANERPLLQERLLRDESLQAEWSRFHLIRDILQGHYLETGQPNVLAGCVKESIATEASLAMSGGKSGLLRPIFGIAIAASVAALAIIGIRTVNLDRSESTVEVARNVPVQKQATNNQIESAAAVANRLHGYLVDHSSYTGSGPMQGMIPLSRLATYEMQE